MKTSKSIKFSMYAILLGIVMVLIIAPALPDLFSYLDCQTQEINIKTGQARYRNYRFFIRKDDRIEDTVLSLLVSNRVDVTDISEWKMVNSFSPSDAKVSPHFEYHGAFRAVRIMESLVALYDLGDHEKRDVAKQVLILWQKHERDREADQFIADILSNEMDKKDPKVHNNSMGGILTREELDAARKKSQEKAIK